MEAWTFLNYWGRAPELPPKSTPCLIKIVNAVQFGLVGLHCTLAAKPMFYVGPQISLPRLPLQWSTNKYTIMVPVHSSKKLENHQFSKKNLHNEIVTSYAYSGPIISYQCQKQKQYDEFDECRSMNCVTLQAFLQRGYTNIQQHYITLQEGQYFPELVQLQKISLCNR